MKCENTGLVLSDCRRETSNKGTSNKKQSYSIKERTAAEDSFNRITGPERAVAFGLQAFPSAL